MTDMISVVARAILEGGAFRIDKEEMEWAQNAAKAVIVAMRVPTDEMADKGENALIFAKDVEPPSDVPSGTWWAAVQCWQAMLAALEVKE